MAVNPTVGGINLGNARKIGERFFNQCLDKVILNEKCTCFLIYIYDQVDPSLLDDFQEKWPEFEIFTVTVKPYPRKKNKAQS